MIKLCYGGQKQHNIGQVKMLLSFKKLGLNQHMDDSVLNTQFIIAAIPFCINKALKFDFAYQIMNAL